MRWRQCDRAIEKENRQTTAAVETQIAELRKTIASHEVDLSRSISINGLDEHTTRAVMTFKDRLSRGEDLKTPRLLVQARKIFLLRECDQCRRPLESNDFFGKRRRR
jgi:hypothetical protein